MEITSLCDEINVDFYTTSGLTEPKKGTKTPDIFGVVISPPNANAILRSPAATGLSTKTYVNNDFRQLRQVQCARLNTSRLPSTHGMSFLVCLSDLWIGVADEFFLSKIYRMNLVNAIVDVGIKSASF